MKRVEGKMANRDCWRRMDRSFFFFFLFGWLIDRREVLKRNIYLFAGF